LIEMDDDINKFRSDEVGKQVEARRGFHTSVQNTADAE